jgi:hypothetical protein
MCAEHKGHSTFTMLWPPLSQCVYAKFWGPLINSTSWCFHATLKWLLFVLTNYLTQWSTVLPQKLTGPQPVTRFSTVCRTQRFISAFTVAPHLSLFSAISTQSKLPHPTSWRYILIFSYPPTPRLSIRSPNRTLYTADKTNHTIMTVTFANVITGEIIVPTYHGPSKFFKIYPLYVILTEYFDPCNYRTSTDESLILLCTVCLVIRQYLPLNLWSVE